MEYRSFFKISVCLSFIFAPLVFAKAPSSQQIVEELQWQQSATSTNYCHGYFRDNFLDTPPKDLNADQTRIQADEASLIAEGKSVLSGNVVIEQSSRRVFADQAFIYRDASGEITRIDLYGHVRSEAQGKLIYAEEAHLYPNDVIELKKIRYRMELAESNLDGTGKTNAHGWGERYKRHESGIISIRDATYTTCSPVEKVWRVRAEHLELDREKGRGYARNATFLIKDVPIAYLPYLNFPIDDRRETGFLFPTYSNSNRSGFNLNVPFYWNMAPNYDATITPQWYSKRGILTEGLFRYLDTHGSGNLDGTFMPHDSAFAEFKSDQIEKHPPSRLRSNLEDTDNDRWFYHLGDEHRFGEHWSTHIDFNRVSDDYYFQDFGSGLWSNTQNQLNQIGTVYFSSLHWGGTLNFQNYQTLHPINSSPVSDPYVRLPQLAFWSDYPDVHDVNYQLSGEGVYFDKPNDPYTGERYTSGQRYHLEPSVAYPVQSSVGFLIPKLKLMATQYNVTLPAPGEPASVNSVIPIFSLDSGVYFDREWRIGDHFYQQTLEPRLFYLYVPFHDQTDLPIFDTNLQPFSSNLLFVDNRFSGIDRIGDANQVTVALTSRFLDDNDGSEKVNLTLGQIYYFQDRKVPLCYGTTCIDDDIGNPSNTTSDSPLVANFTYQFYPDWYFNLGSAWDIDNSEFFTASSNFYYKKGDKRIVNVGYNFLRNGDQIEGQVKNVQQANLSFYWPIKEQWGTIAGWYYDFTERRSLLLFGGVEYSGCCYAARLVAEKSFVNADVQGKEKFENTVYLQILLKSLGSVGRNDAGSLLQTHVPGYYDLMDK